MGRVRTTSGQFDVDIQDLVGFQVERRAFVRVEASRAHPQHICADLEIGHIEDPGAAGGRLPNASRAAVGHSDLRFDDKPPLGSVTTPVIDPKVLWAMLTEEKAKLIRISPRTNRCLSNIFPPQKLRRTRDITNPRSVQSRRLL